MWLNRPDWKLKNYTNVTAQACLWETIPRLQRNPTLAEDLGKLLQMFAARRSLLSLSSLTWTHTLKTQDWVKEATASEQNKMLCFTAFSRKEPEATLSGLSPGEVFIIFSFIGRWYRESLQQTVCLELSPRRTQERLFISFTVLLEDVQIW